MNKDKCKTCKHWKRHDGKMGLCGKIYKDHDVTRNPGTYNPTKRDVPNGVALRPHIEHEFEMLMGEGFGCVHWEN